MVFFYIAAFGFLSILFLTLRDIRIYHRTKIVSYRKGALRGMIAGALAIIGMGVTIDNPQIGLTILLVAVYVNRKGKREDVFGDAPVIKRVLGETTVKKAKGFLSEPTRAFEISKEEPLKDALKYYLKIAILFLIVIAYFLIHPGSDKWSVSSDGVLSYPENRGKVDVSTLKTESGNNYTLETISFQSKDYTVEGLLRIPSSEKKVPVVVILPGATVPKEGTQGLAQILSGMGYASLGIEQRNRGRVDPQYDFTLFKDGKEPVEHKMVFDALRAVDILKQDVRIDAGRIAILGESNGGRFAIIAAALDHDIKGLIGISTSGYDMESQLASVTDETALRFYRSIDPDTYLNSIPPRRFVMIHSVNDSIIPLGLAQNTFGKAKEPKIFYKIETGNHGFSEGMRGHLEDELKLIFR